MFILRLRVMLHSVTSPSRILFQPISCDADTRTPLARASLQFEHDIPQHLPSISQYQVHWISLKHTWSNVEIKLQLTSRPLQKLPDLPRYESDIWWVTATPCKMTPDRWDHMQLSILEAGHFNCAILRL
jgi:hypothetical protein